MSITSRCDRHQNCKCKDRCLLLLKTFQGAVGLAVAQNIDAQLLSRLLHDSVGLSTEGKEKRPSLQPCSTRFSTCKCLWPVSRNQCDFWLMEGCNRMFTDYLALGSSPCSTSTGGLRCRVACSYAYAQPSKSPSFQGRADSSKPNGRPPG